MNNSPKFLKLKSLLKLKTPKPSAEPDFIQQDKEGDDQVSEALKAAKPKLFRVANFRRITRG